MLILMVDLIFEYCVTVVMFVVSIFVYILLASRILPGLLLSPKLGGTLCERGIKKSVFAGGRSVTYEPKLSLRKYISQYVLFSHNGGKYIKCKINDKVKSLKYVLVVYDRKNKAVSKIEISETVEEEGYTSEVMLPPETSYVHLQLCSVNGISLKDREPEIYSGRRAAVFLISVFAMTLAETCFANYIIVFLSDVLLGYFRAVPEADFTATLLVMLAVSFAATLLIFAINIANPCRFTWDKDKKKKAEKN